MPVDMLWDSDEQRIIRYEFSETWTWDEYYEATETAQELIDSVENPVDIIFWQRDSYLPSNVFVQGKRLAASIPKQTKIIAIIGANPIYRTFGKIFGRLFPQQAAVYVYVNNLEEARQMIAKRRDDIETEENKR